MSRMPQNVLFDGTSIPPYPMSTDVENGNRPERYITPVGTVPRHQLEVQSRLASADTAQAGQASFVLDIELTARQDLAQQFLAKKNQRRR